MNGAAHSLATINSASSSSINRGSSGHTTRAHQSADTESEGHLLITGDSTRRDHAAARSDTLHASEGFEARLGNSQLENRAFASLVAAQECLHAFAADAVRKVAVEGTAPAAAETRLEVGICVLVRWLSVLYGGHFE
jgi:hypothetical protein